MRQPVKASLILLMFLLVAQTQAWAALREEKKDKNQDGKTDQWLRYNSKGRLAQKAADTNSDGKPDQFQTYLNGGRDFVIKEYDRNFDGKIDKRVLNQWDPAKSIPLVNQGRITRIPNPGYGTLEKEEDSNFDGTIDIYYKKKDKKQKSDLTPSKVGQPMDGSPRVLEDSVDVSGVEPTAAKPPESQADRLNEKYGY